MDELLRFLGLKQPNLVTSLPKGGLQAHNLPADSGPFKFKMGQSEYDWVRPQLEKLFTAKQSPLTNLLDEFIQAGERYKIDPRILATIANNESSLGKTYPQESYNPFGYIWLGGKQPQNYADIVAGLKGAGFTSLPHAIDRLTGRFARQPTESYKKFYQEPTFSNLQMAYNANPAERENYLKNANDLLQFFQ